MMPKKPAVFFLTWILLAGILLYGVFRSLPIWGNGANKAQNQGLVIPGNDKTYAQAIGQSYRLLVERYVVPFSPKQLYDSAQEAMQVVNKYWQKEEQKLGIEGEDLLLDLEQKARYNPDVKKATEIRAPKRSQLSDEETQELATEYQKYSGKDLSKEYTALLAKSRLEGYYSHEFARKLYTEILAALCRPLQDPFSGFFQDSGFYQLSDTTNGSFGGIGLYIGKAIDFGEGSEDGDSYQSLQRHYVKVSRPFPGGPSFRAGIMADDFIYAVDGESAKDWSVEQVQNTVRGVPNTKVEITVLRARKHKLSFEVLRERIEVPAVNSDMIRIPAAGDQEINIVYVNLLQFNALAGKQFEEQVGKLLQQKNEVENRRQGADALLLDMRNNPGGLLNVAVEIADQFLAGGAVVSTDARSSSNRLQYSAKDAISIPKDLPVFVMVNRESASAAEIVAGALQDSGRAEVLGEKSFGKGSVQVPVTLPEGILKITIAHFYTPRGINLANNGIQPDQSFAVPKLSEGEEEGLLQLLKSGLVAGFVSESPEYTDAEFQGFFAGSIAEKFSVSRNMVKRMAYRERMRFMEELPIYNLEYDIILRDTVAYIAEKLAPDKIALQSSVQG